MYSLVVLRTLSHNNLRRAIEPFDPSAQHWKAYRERFEQNLMANYIKEEEQIVAMFLITIGSETFHVSRYLIAPTKASKVKFEDLLETLRDHCKPKPIVMAERFHFTSVIDKLVVLCKQKLKCYWRVNSHHLSSIRADCFDKHVKVDTLYVNLVFASTA